MNRQIRKKGWTKKQIMLIVSGCTIVFYLYFVTCIVACFYNTKHNEEIKIESAFTQR